MEIEKSCCITGRRKIPLACQEHVLHLLKKKVQEALCDGFRCFLSGFADGADQNDDITMLMFELV